MVDQDSTADLLPLPTVSVWPYLRNPDAGGPCPGRRRLDQHQEQLQLPSNLRWADSPARGQRERQAHPYPRGGSTAVFIPEAFNVTFEFTLPGEPTQSETDTSSKPNMHGDLVTCSFDVTQTFPERGTVHLFGTATGFFTPAS